MLPPRSHMHIPGKEVSGRYKETRAHMNHRFRHTFCLFKKEITQEKEVG